MKTNTKIKINGLVRIYSNGELVLEKKNAVQAGSMDIIRRGLAGFAGSVIRNIEAYNDSTLLATNATDTPPELPVSGSNNLVKFSTTFSKESFTGVFNKLQLRSGLGVFSILTGFSNEKTEFHTLKIEWLLEIVII
jgi:hypothetical protein